MRIPLILIALSVAAPAFATTRTGVIRQIVQEDADAATRTLRPHNSGTAWQLLRGRTRVVPVAPDPRLVPGAKMRLRGAYAADGTFVASTLVTGVKLIKQPALTPAGTHEHMVVIPLAFADLPITQPWASWAAEFAHERTFYQQASYGQMDLDMQLLPILTSPSRTKDLACDLGAYVYEAMRLARDLVDFRSVTIVTVVLPYTGDYGAIRYCPDPNDPRKTMLPFAQATIGKGAIATPDGTVMLGLEQTNEYWPSVPHETGHVLGLEHAHTLECGLLTAGVPADLSSCTLEEYGDFLDMMGPGTHGDFSLIHKRQLGWITGAHYVSVPLAGSGSFNVGTYTLDALEVAGGLQGVYLPVAGVGWLALEARFWLGADAIPWIPEVVLDGVQVHATFAALPIVRGTDPHTGALLYGTIGEHEQFLLWPWIHVSDAPAYRTASEALIRVGQSFTQWPWKITTVSRDATAHRTVVRVDDLRHPPVSPTSAPSPIPSPAIGAAPHPTFPGCYETYCCPIVYECPPTPHP